ncbi:MAG TPA: hypothetical protein VF265_08015 [Nevskiaceae bacterium]
MPRNKPDKELWPSLPDASRKAHPMSGLAIASTRAAGARSAPSGGCGRGREPTEYCFVQRVGVRTSARTAGQFSVPKAHRRAASF